MGPLILMVPWFIWFMQFSGSYSPVVRAVQWFLQFSGSCSSVVHVDQWFSGSSSSVVRAVQ